MDIPESLQKKLDFFKASGGLIPGTEELFQPTSWYAVFTGMGVEPNSYNPTVDTWDYQKLKGIMEQGKQGLIDITKQQPSHDEFLQQYCPAPKI